MIHNGAPCIDNEAALSLIRELEDQVLLNYTIKAHCVLDKLDALTMEEIEL